MQPGFRIRNFHEWAEIIYDPDRDFMNKILGQRRGLRKMLIEKVAESLYEDLRKAGLIDEAPGGKTFEGLDSEAKTRWYEYASRISAKIKSLGLMLRPASGPYRSCIITDEEIEKLARSDYVSSKPAGGAFDDLPEDQKNWYRNLNYLIPYQLKKAGFELMRPGEAELINPLLVNRMAKAIHARYVREMRGRSIEGVSGTEYVMEFEELPLEIRHANIDSAYHITTKLLSIGYRISPAEKGHQAAALRLNPEHVETMAKLEHIRWCWNKRLNGWTYGVLRDNEKKTHPSLVPYELLPESEKEKDREIVRGIPSLLQDSGFVALSVFPGKLRSISYALKPVSSLHRLLKETSLLSREIRQMTSLNPSIEEKINIIIRKIEETTAEVEGSYNYARNIQETFLPDDLYVRECFPESFVLFRPKDIVSGDFYFFSRQGEKIIFAAADCTGHGIPGAMLSLVGYGLIDQAVNEIKIHEPSDILAHLYSRIHKYLRKKDGLVFLPDDLDITVCCFEASSMNLTYSGVSVPFYVVTDGTLREFRAGNTPDDAGKADHIFNSGVIKLRKGDSVYMFTDGFADQFGGKSHKKYSRSGFRSFLLSIKDLTMPEQKDMLHEELEGWREIADEDQTDDILVMGIRI